jgi:hypothetical protein
VSCRTAKKLETVLILPSDIVRENLMPSSLVVSCRVVSCRVASCRVVSYRLVPGKILLHVNRPFYLTRHQAWAQWAWKLGKAWCVWKFSYWGPNGMKYFFSVDLCSKLLAYFQARYKGPLRTPPPPIGNDFKQLPPAELWVVRSNPAT